MRFVLDASLTLAWCFKDEKTKFTEAVDGSGRRMGLKQAANELGVPLLSEEHLEAWAKEVSESEE